MTDTETGTNTTGTDTTGTDADQVAARIAQLTQERDTVQAELTEARTREASAVTALRDTLRAAHPDVAGLIDGQSAAELATAAASALEVRAAILAAASTAKPPPVPSGATQPAPPNLDAMSPQQKIAYALRQKHIT